MKTRTKRIAPAVLPSSHPPSLTFALSLPAARSARSRRDRPDSADPDAEDEACCLTMPSRASIMPSATRASSTTPRWSPASRPTTCRCNGWQQQEAAHSLQKQRTAIPANRLHTAVVQDAVSTLNNRGWWGASSAMHRNANAARGRCAIPRMWLHEKTAHIPYNSHKRHHPPIKKIETSSRRNTLTLGAPVRASGCRFGETPGLHLRVPSSGLPAPAPLNNGDSDSQLMARRATSGRTLVEPSITTSHGENDPIARRSSFKTASFISTWSLAWGTWSKFTCGGGELTPRKRKFSGVFVRVPWWR